MDHVKPFLHDHYLLFDHYSNQEAICNECNQQIDSWAYTCESCNFWLHSSCAEQLLPQQISHPSHSQHLLTLYHTASNFLCKRCFTLSRGHRYICHDCNFEIEVLCASVDDKVSDAEGEGADGRYKFTSHFIHYDSLTLCKYRKVKSDYDSCKWCDRFVSGMCYGCFRCFEEFFVHESCLVKIPTRIFGHPFHPSHTLYVQETRKSGSNCNACKYGISDGYYCQKCDFWLHFFCSRLQLSLKHESHEHTLTYFPMERRFALQCNLCSQEILNTSHYRCVQCDFNLHLSCIPIPPTTTHEYHRHALTYIHSFIEDDSGEYYCDICEEERNPIDPFYYCKECRYVAHVGCTINKVGSKALMPKPIEQEETEKGNGESLTQLAIEHFNHEHPLQFYEVIEKNEDLLCNACNSEISARAYGCESCKYYFHQACANLSHEVLHPLHSKHPLKLFSNTKELMCFHCKDFTVGFIYKCLQCNFMLDVKCATSATPDEDESQRLKEMKRDSKSCFFNKDHELFFFNFRHKPDSSFKCGICYLPILGQSVDCEDCHYVLHESCLEFPGEIQLPILSKHPSRPILMGTGSSCYACRCNIEKEGIAYIYRQGRYYSLLHLPCANSLRRAIKIKSLHQHRLFYFGEECQKLFSYMTELEIDFSNISCWKCHESFDGMPFFLLHNLSLQSSFEMCPHTTLCYVKMSCSLIHSQRLFCGG